MIQSTKKLTALFLSMCMAASMVSVSAVSASALDGDGNNAVDISGKSEFEYTGDFTGKYVSSSGDKLVTLTPGNFDSLYVGCGSENAIRSYTPDEKSAYFVAEKGREYEIHLYEPDESTARKCTVTKKDIPRLKDGESVDGEIADDNYVSVFSYVPGETGVFKLSSCVSEPFCIDYYRGGSLDKTISHSKDGAFDEFECKEGEVCYLIYRLNGTGTAEFTLTVNKSSVELGETASYENPEPGSGTYTFKAPDDMSVMFGSYIVGGESQKVTLTDPENNVIAEKTSESGYDNILIPVDVKKGEKYNVKFENTGGVMAYFGFDRIIEITSGTPFSVSDNSDFYRYVAQSDCTVSFSAQSGSPDYDTFNSSLDVNWEGFLKKGETYYFAFSGEGVFTLNENPLIITEIKPGETKELSLTDNYTLLMFKPEKDTYVHYYPSVTSDEAVSECFVTTYSGDYVSEKNVYDTGEDFDIYFKAEAGKSYLLCNYVRDGAADIRVTLEETSPYIIGDGVFWGDLTNQSEVSVPSFYNPPYDPKNPDEYLNPEGSGAREVTEIASDAFSFNDDLVSAEVPDTVKKIDRWAFYECKKLESVKLSDNLETIGEDAFSYCESLKKITIPDSVASIGDSAFEGCAAMNEVKLPKNIEIISECTFKGCESLKEVTVPKSVTSIGEYALGYSDEWNDDENARGYKKYDGFTIKGCRGTEAERYANDNGFTFVALDDGPNPTVYGDANGDGEIDISDVTAIQKYAAAYEKFNAAQLKYADVNKDGAVDINDATAVQKYIAGIIKSFD